MSDQHAGHGGHDEGDTTGTHGMLLFGDDTLYLSHLPMFTSPHNFQVLLEVSFDEAVRDVLTSDRQDGGGGMYTFVPLPFPITELSPEAGSQRAARTSFEGTMFRGHFEQGGEPISEGVMAQVERVAHFAVLDVDAERRQDQELTYLCFGDAGQHYLAHDIGARPSFDQVLRVRLVPGTGTDQSGRPLSEEVATRSFDVTAPVLFTGRVDSPQSRLGRQEVAKGFFFQSVGPAGVHGFFVQIETESELYLQIDELT